MRALTKWTGVVFALVVATSSQTNAWQNYSGPYLGGLDAKVDAGGDLAFGFNTRFAVRKLSGTTGVEQWLYATTSSNAAALGVAFDDAGNVVAAGYEYPSLTDDIVVAKLDGTYGSEIWRRVIDGGTNLYDFANAVVAVPGVAGDVVIAGSLTSAALGEFAVLRLDGSDGSTQWTYTFPSAGNNEATAVALDGAGDVIAVGRVGSTFCVVKLNGATGAEVWRRQISGLAYRVVVATNGDAIAGGIIANDFGVVRLAAADGATVWTRTHGGTDVASGDFVRGLALDATGDVYAAGYFLNTNGTSFVVMKVAGATGSELWLHELQGDVVIGQYAGAEAIALDPSGSGDVIAGGFMQRNFGLPDVFFMFTVVRLDGATGTEEWRRVIEPLYPFAPDRDGGVSALATDTAGHVFAVGSTGDGNASAVRLGLDGTPGLVNGNVLIVKDRDGAPSKRSILARAKNDARIETPPPGDPADPRTAGATLRLANPTTGESATFALPPGAGWTGLGNPAGSQGYKYKDPSGANGPCAQLLAKDGQLFQFKCRSSVAGIPFTLDEAAQATLTASVQFGTQLPQCMAFGYGVSGTIVKRDRPASLENPAGMFSAIGYAHPGFGSACPP